MTPRHLARSCVSPSGQIHASDSPITNLRIGILQLNGRRAARLSGAVVCPDARGATKGRLKSMEGIETKCSAKTSERSCSTAAESVCCILTPAPCTVKLNAKGIAGCASREADSVIDHLHSPTDFGSVRNVGNDGPKSLFVLPRRWGRRSQALRYSQIGDHRLGRLISEKSWTSRAIDHPRWTKAFQQVP